MQNRMASTAARLRPRPTAHVIAACLLPALLVSAVSLSAQDSSRPALGFALGLNGMPRVWVSECGYYTAPFDDLARDFTAELRGSQPVARHFSLEGRATLHGFMSFRECAAIIPTHPDGIANSRAYPSQGTGTLATDLRLRWDDDDQLAVSAGGGWLWAMHAPYVAVGPGLRLGQRVRFLLDGEYLLGRFPYHAVVTDWRSNTPTLVVSTETHEWRSLVGVRAGVEVRIK